MHMINSGAFATKKILLVDRDAKKKNDRTWCFWETAPGLFEHLVFQRWKEAWFHHPAFSKLLFLEPYEYKLIRGIDFYDHCFSVIGQQNNIDVRMGEITGLEGDGPTASITIDGERVEAEYIFNSILLQKPEMGRGEYYIQQHFKGQVINTSTPVFNPAQATLMDFRADQQHGTTFLYVMPFSETRALIEYTLFSRGLLAPEAYQAGLQKYMREELKIDQYTVEEEEFGIIPMTNHRFPTHEGRIINMGTAGGQTKASSGYTFRFIQLHAAAIVRNLQKGNGPIVPAAKKRFLFYDSVLLNILYKDSVPGDKIFSRLFQKNPTEQVLKFLDNESSLLEEINIISSLPTWPFLKAGLQQL